MNSQCYGPSFAAFAKDGIPLRSPHITAAFLASHLCQRGWLLIGSFAIQRQEDGKRGTVFIRPGPALQPDGPAMFLNNAARDPQSQAGADIFLGSKEWVEQVFSVLRFDPVAGIENGDANSGPMCSVPCMCLPDPDCQRPSAWHGVDRVAEQVGKCLAQFAHQRSDFNVPVILLYHADLP